MKYSVIYGKGIRIDDFKDISSARMYAYDVARRTAEVQIWGGDYYGCETFRGLVKRMKKRILLLSDSGNIIKRELRIINR